MENKKNAKFGDGPLNHLTQNESGAEAHLSFRSQRTGHLISSSSAAAKFMTALD